MVAGIVSGRGWRAMLFDAAGHRYDSGSPIHVEGWTYAFYEPSVAEIR